MNALLGECHDGTKEPMFVSLDFNLTGSALPPIDPVDAVARLPRSESAELP
jgi:hypothetical protein